MEKTLSEMEIENKYNRTSRKEDLVIEMGYTITGTKCVTTKYGKKLVIIIDLKGEMGGLFAPKSFDAKSAYLEKIR